MTFENIYNNFKLMLLDITADRESKISDYYSIPIKTNIDLINCMENIFCHRSEKLRDKISFSIEMNYNNTIPTISTAYYVVCNEVVDEYEVETVLFKGKIVRFVMIDEYYFKNNISTILLSLLFYEVRVISSYCGYNIDKVLIEIFKLAPIVMYIKLALDVLRFDNDEIIKNLMLRQITDMELIMLYLHFTNKFNISYLLDNSGIYMIYNEIKSKMDEENPNNENTESKHDYPI